MSFLLSTKDDIKFTCDERVDNLIAVRCHGFRKRIFHCQSQFFLRFKYSIQFQVGQLRSNNIVDVCRNLLVGIGQRVKGFVHFITQDLVLNTDDGSQKDIVQRLGFHPNIQLLNTKTDFAHHGLHGTNNDITTCIREAIIFSPCFNDTCQYKRKERNRDSEWALRWQPARKQKIFETNRQFNKRTDFSSRNGKAADTHSSLLLSLWWE